MTHIIQVDPQQLIERASIQLKSEKLVEPLAWAAFVKTSRAKERLPVSQDWWYVRSAALLRSIAKLGPVGTQKLRTKYGSKKNRGHKPERFYRASGSIIRKILQQLEASGLIKQTQIGNHKGRNLTPKGVSLLDKIAVNIAKESRAKAQ